METILKWAETWRSWGGSIAVALLGIWIRIRKARQEELQVLINELQEECQRKGIENTNLHNVVNRLMESNNRQRLEVYLHCRVKRETIDELRQAIEALQGDREDSIVYVNRAIARLEEDIVVPCGDSDARTVEEESE